MKRLLSILAVAAALGAAASSDSQLTGAERNLAVFNSIVRDLVVGYVDTLDTQEALQTAIDGLLSHTDPYTEYFPPENSDELLSVSSGEFGGIGSVISTRKGGDIFIYRPTWDAPAHRAGLRHGDVIKRVNGTEVTPEMTTADVSRMLRGDAGTAISIDVLRHLDPTDSLMTFDFTRGTIRTNVLPWYGMLDDDIAYIELTTFNEHSASLFKQALLDLMASHPGLKGLVIDLRNNGGGLLESAVQIAGLFVDKGTEIVSMRGRQNLNSKTFKTLQQPIAPKLPLAVLINSGTASAAEILAGSLQDLDRAVVVGQRSFGKGLVQNSRQMPYGGLFKLTVARYYIPSGRLIQAIDYSHRDAEGNPVRIPDSLTNEFRTRHGRTVRDGGGITPDITTPLKDYNSLLYTLANDLWVYDFATRYAARHPEIAPETDFEITDEIFDQFKAWIDPERLDYDRYFDSGIKYLHDAAERDGYLTDSLQAQLDILSKMLTRDLNHDLDFNRQDIREMLDAEITERYYSDSQMSHRQALRDPAVTRARDILRDPAEYRSILEPK